MSVLCIRKLLNNAGSRSRFQRAVFSPHGRLKAGIRVDEFRDHQGVWRGTIFDAGFQLPPLRRGENDWLGIERDHSHRLSDSKYLLELCKCRKV